MGIRNLIGRRQWMRLAGAGALSCTGGVAPRRAPPNVLLICLDDLRPWLGCYGNEFVSSPNIDSFARTARLFSRHYVQVAACGPSRCSMLTGRRLDVWDCWQSQRQLVEEPKDPTSFAHVFRRNGYRTICVGKVSHQPGGVLDEPQTVHEVPFSWDESYAPTGEWRTPWRAFFSYSGAKAYNGVPGIKMQRDAPFPPFESADVSDVGYADGLNAQEAVKQLRELAGRKQPFLLAVGFYKPHLPFNAPKRYWDLYNPDAIPFVQNPLPPRNVDRQLSLHSSSEVTQQYLWPAGKGNISPEQARILRHGYLACVSYVDAQIGKVLRELDNLNLARNTIVVLWSDNGFHLGEHGLFGKWTNFDVALRTPLIIRVPGMAYPGRPAHGFVEAVDLYPTLMELCGLAGPANLAGQSLVPMLKDPDAEVKRHTYSFSQAGRISARSIRTHRFRLIHWKDTMGQTVQTELYDYSTDDDETVNIAADRPAIVSKLLALLNAETAGSTSQAE